MGYTPPYLEVRKITGGWSASSPSSTTGDDLYLYGNTTDANAKIVIEGNGSIYLYTVANGFVSVVDGGGNDSQIRSANNKNLYLNPQGTGKIKVAGTATATGDVAINGHYDILDSTGATIKLATVA